MNAFDATKPTIDPFNSSPFASSMPNRDENDVMTYIPHIARTFPRNFVSVRVTT